LEGGLSRALWKIATSFGKTPQQLHRELTSLQWEWALSNYNRDIQETSDLLTVCYEALQPWLNPEMYQSLQKKRQTAESPAFVNFIQALKEKGASTEDIDSVLKDVGMTEEEFDKVEVLAAPWLKEKEK